MMNGKLSWASDSEFSIEGVEFFATVDASQYHSRKSDGGRFLIVKDRSMIEQELSICGPETRRNVVDIGIWQGGSVAMLDLVFKPNKLVALEYAKRDLPMLDSYIRAHGRRQNVSVNNGVDQGNSKLVRSIMEKEFRDEPLDLVVDDASHLYENTTRSFNVLFPRLRKGGLFIIEDWRWSTRVSHCESEYFKGKVGLANLVVQYMILCAVRPDVVANVMVCPGMTVVTRGEGVLAADFDIAGHALNRGQPVPLYL